MINENLYSWEYARTKAHDASGIKSPELYDWIETNNIFYPNQIVWKVIGSKWRPNKVKETIYWNNKDGSIKIIRVRCGVELSVKFDYVS